MAVEQARGPVPAAAAGPGRRGSGGGSPSPARSPSHGVRGGQRVRAAPALQDGLSLAARTPETLVLLLPRLHRLGGKQEQRSHHPPLHNAVPKDPTPSPPYWRRSGSLTPPHPHQAHSAACRGSAGSGAAPGPCSPPGAPRAAATASPGPGCPLGRPPGCPAGPRGLGAAAAKMEAGGAGSAAAPAR